MKLTTEEIRNGWTEQTLAAYHKERATQKLEYEMDQAKKNPAVKTENVNSFNPHNWLEG